MRRSFSVSGSIVVPLFLSRPSGDPAMGHKHNEGEALVIIHGFFCGLFDGNALFLFHNALDGVTKPPLVAGAKFEFLEVVICALLIHDV